MREALHQIQKGTAIPLTDHGRVGPPVLPPVSESSASDPKPKKQAAAKCNWSRSWRNFCPLAAQLPDTITPGELVKLLFYFSVMHSIQEVCNAMARKNGQTMDKGVVRKAFFVFRSWLTVFQARVWQPLGDGTRRYAIVIDSFYLIPPGKYDQAETEKRKIQIFGGVELDLSTTPRRCTGKGFLRMVPSGKGLIYKKIVDAVVAQKSSTNKQLLFTDEEPSYMIFDGEFSAYERVSVCRLASSGGWLFLLEMGFV